MRFRHVATVAGSGIALALASAWVHHAQGSGGHSAPQAAADQSDGPEAPRGAAASGGDGTDTAAWAAAIRPLRSGVTNTVRELARRRSRLNLTETETNAVAQAVADCTVDYQAVNRRLARISIKDASRTVVSVPAFPEAGRALEKELMSGIASALDDRAKGTELASELAAFLANQFRGFGQYPREISIGIIRDDTGALFYSFEDHWTGGWSGHLSGQPADASVTAADRSTYRPDDLQDYEFLRPFLPAIPKMDAPAPPAVPPEH